MVGKCWPNTEICRYCYKWGCRKFAIERAKTICKKVLSHAAIPDKLKKDCHNRVESGKWLTPAYIKKKRKKTEIISSKIRPETNSKKYPRSKLRSARRVSKISKVNGEEENKSLASNNENLENENNIQYFIT